MEAGAQPKSNSVSRLVAALISFIEEQKTQPLEVGENAVMVFFFTKLLVYFVFE